MKSQSAEDLRIRLRPERCIHEAPGRASARVDRPQWRSGRRVQSQVPNRPPCRRTPPTDCPRLWFWTPKSPTVAPKRYGVVLASTASRNSATQGLAPALLSHGDVWSVYTKAGGPT